MCGQGPRSVPEAQDAPSPSRGALLVAVSSGKADSQEGESPATTVTSHVPSRLLRSHPRQGPARCTLSGDTSPAGPSLTGALGPGGRGSVHGGGSWWGQGPSVGTVTCDHSAAGHSGSLQVWPSDQQHRMPWGRQEYRFLGPPDLPAQNLQRKRTASTDHKPQGPGEGTALSWCPDRVSVRPRGPGTLARACWPGAGRTFRQGQGWGMGWPCPDSTAAGEGHCHSRHGNTLAQERKETAAVGGHWPWVDTEGAWERRRGRDGQGLASEAEGRPLGSPRDQAEPVQPMLQGL